MGDQLSVVELLLARLNAKEPSGHYQIGGGKISSDGTSEYWGGGPVMRQRNPDGPQAATLILSLQEQLARASWQPIESAPKDGTLLDLWCVSPPDCDFTPEGGGIRLTDCSWTEPVDYFPHQGWARVTDDGNWDLVDAPPTSPLGIPRWVPTHWMPLPEPPARSTLSPEPLVSDDG